MEAHALELDPTMMLHQVVLSGHNYRQAQYTDFIQLD